MSNGFDYKFLESNAIQQIIEEQEKSDTDTDKVFSDKESQDNSDNDYLSDEEQKNNYSFLETFKTCKRNKLRNPKKRQDKMPQPLIEEKYESD